MTLSDSQENYSIEDLIPSFKSRGMNLGLKRIENVINRMGNPCKELPAIQIAGTNGKGSIASFLESSLIKAGIKVGCTTSPHLIDWCERIRIDGEMITKEQFRDCINTVREFSAGEDLTPFELVIASAFNYFSENKIELMILEVGLGGRLDATTAHPFRPLIAMAAIGLDHCEVLGEDISEITKEKAAIISPGSTVISSNQSQEVKEILEEAVLRNNAKISWVSPLSSNWDLGLPGEIQRANAAVAKGILESLTSLGWEINHQQIKEGLASAIWPGRLQTQTWKNQPLILDGAHNPQAMKQLSKERSCWTGQKKYIHWIIGIQLQKDAPTMLRNLLKEQDIAWIVPIPNHQSWGKEELAIACPEFSHQFRQIENVIKVLELLRAQGEWPSPPPVVTGSLYLIGELLSNLKEPNV